MTQPRFLAELEHLGWRPAPRIPDRWAIEVTGELAEDGGCWTCLEVVGPASNCPYPVRVDGRLEWRGMPGTTCTADAPGQGEG